MFLEDKNLNPTRTLTPDLPGLIAWLETQEPEAEYCWVDIRSCLFARFGLALGLSENPSDAYDAVTGALRKRYGMTHGGEPFGWDSGFSCRLAHDHPRTFGGALARARKLLAEVER